MLYTNDVQSYTKGLGTDMAPWAKHLPCKPDHLGLNPQNPHESPTLLVVPVNLSTFLLGNGRGDRMSPEAPGSASLEYTAVNKTDPVSNEIEKED